MNEDPIFYMIKEIKNDVKQLEEKIDQLLELKWKITGASIAICALIAVIFELGKLALHKG